MNDSEKPKYGYRPHRDKPAERAAREKQNRKQKAERNRAWGIAHGYQVTTDGICNAKNRRVCRNWYDLWERYQHSVEEWERDNE